MSIDTSKLRNPQIKLWAEQELGKVPQLVDFGTPVLADVDNIVASANMKVGSYTIAAQPDVPRNITVSHTIVATGTDTLGIITVTGTDVNGQVISEAITPLAGTIASGVKAFKTITSVVGYGWVIAGGNDTITVGVGACLGMPFIVPVATNVAYAIVGTSITTPTVVVNATEISKNTVSTATYDGSKRVFAMCLV